MGRHHSWLLDSPEGIWMPNALEQTRQAHGPSIVSGQIQNDGKSRSFPWDQSTRETGAKTCALPRLWCTGFLAPVSPVNAMSLMKCICGKFLGCQTVQISVGCLLALRTVNLVLRQHCKLILSIDVNTNVCALTCVF